MQLRGLLDLTLLGQKELIEGNILPSFEIRLLIYVLLQELLDLLRKHLQAGLLQLLQHVVELLQLPIHRVTLLSPFIYQLERALSRDGGSRLGLPTVPMDAAHALLPNTLLVGRYLTELLHLLPPELLLFHANRKAHIFQNLNQVPLLQHHVQQTNNLLLSLLHLFCHVIYLLLHLVSLVFGEPKLISLLFILLNYEIKRIIFSLTFHYVAIYTV